MSQDEATLEAEAVSNLLNFSNSPFTPSVLKPSNPIIHNIPPLDLRQEEKKEKESGKFSFLLAATEQQAPFSSPSSTTAASTPVRSIIRARAVGSGVRRNSTVEDNFNLPRLRSQNKRRAASMINYPFETRASKRRAMTIQIDGSHSEPEYDLTSPNARIGSVGFYSHDERKERIALYIEKRKKRVWKKKIKYPVRKKFADSRVRVKGRFISKDDEAKLRDLYALLM